MSEYQERLYSLIRKLDLSLARLNETIEVYHYETVALQSYIVQYQAIEEKKGITPCLQQNRQ